MMAECLVSGGLVFTRYPRHDRTLRLALQWFWSGGLALSKLPDRQPQTLMYQGLVSGVFLPLRGVLVMTRHPIGETVAPCVGAFMAGNGSRLTGEPVCPLASLPYSLALIRRLSTRIGYIIPFPIT